MNFISYSFLLLFLIVFAVRMTLGRTTQSKTYLLLLIVASVIFYMWHIPYYIVLLLFSTVVDYFAAHGIARFHPGDYRRKWLLAFSLLVNLGVLGYFKYANFFLESILHWLGSSTVSRLDILLPMGISFYTFQSMSYTIDVYRGKLQPVRSFWKLFLYVSFFPQLVAGPIVRAKEFLYQIPRKRKVRLHYLTEGFYLIIRGLFLKMVIADNLGALLGGTGAWNWNTGYGEVVNPLHPGLLVLAFSCQILADFAGYSDIARGICFLLGFRLPINFNYPYLASSFSEFWRRWHITLSAWLRDYVYIPLGGNRLPSLLDKLERSDTPAWTTKILIPALTWLRTSCNLLVVMVLGGLWHGAAWHFVLWGVIHGVALVAERFFCLNRIPTIASLAMVHRLWAIPLKIAWWCVVQATVLTAWIFFRSDTYEHAWCFLTKILDPDWTGTTMANVHFSKAMNADLHFMLIPVAIIVLMHVRALAAETCSIFEATVLERGIWAAVMAYLVLTCYGSANEFIYFVF